MNLVEIASRLNNTKPTHDEEKVEYLRCTTYKVPPFIIPDCSPAKGAKSKWTKKLSQILTFINSVQDKLDDSGRSIIPISTRDSRYQDIWGTPY